ncbi:MAG: 3'-5' exonuclease, partial [candidate division WOR-3 bacterium]
ETRADFLADLTLDPPDSTADLAGPPHKDEDWLVLSTMHSAKGCEWDVVYIIHAADGNIPSDMAAEDEEQLEEERRLFYVAVTRARNWLYVVFPLRYYYRRASAGDGHSYAQLTRFLTPEAQQLMEEQTATARRPDVPDWLKRLWEK